MASMVKSSVDGCWYYDETQWMYILDSLYDALGSFSESDLNHELYITIEHCADKVI